MLALIHVFFLEIQEDASGDTPKKNKAKEHSYNESIDIHFALKIM